MHDLVDVLTDKVQTGYFEPIEKDNFLNLAQMEFVKTRYKAFEVNEKRREDLMPLVVQAGGAGNQIVLNTVPDFFLVLALTSNIEKVDPCSGNVITTDVLVKPMKWDSFWAVQNDPFNRPTQDNVVYLQWNDGANDMLEMPPNTLTFNQWQLTYLRTPAAIDGTNNTGVEPDLPLHTHEEIVNIAVRKMLLNVEQASLYEGQIGENMIME